MVALSKNFLFSGMGQVELEDVCKAMSLLDVEMGETIINRGEWGNRLYVLVKGSVSFETNGNPKSGQPGLHTRKAPVAFGELSMLYSRPRAATVTAVEKCSLWVLSHDIFRKAIASTSSRAIAKQRGSAHNL